MKRIVMDVPRWNVYLHRDARGMEGTRGDRDNPIQKFEDELFDRLYSGETERLPEKKQDQKLRAWADAVHLACEQLPAFSRLASECRGDAMAAGTAVETLMAELAPQLPQEQDHKAPESKPPENALRKNLGRGCEKASAAIDELRETMEGLAEAGFSGMPGNSSQIGGTMPAKAVRALAARLKSDARLKQVALLAGRFKRIAASKRRSRVKHGADEIADIEQGGDLARLLPSELVKLAHPKLRLAFMRSLVEKTSLQYQLIGSEPLGKGPLVVLLDKSGSMDGPRDVWATALTLALLDQAQRERRTFALLGFDYHVKYESVVKPGEPLPEEALFTACAGGTEIGVALSRGLELIKMDRGQLKKADVVLVTDGGSDPGSATKIREDALAMGVTILGLGIGVEREWLQPWCDDIQAVQDLTTIDDKSAEKLFAA
jgi:uncharacterized protein with von Willebrand factor type A (vWA) domain